MWSIDCGMQSCCFTFCTLKFEGWCCGVILCLYIFKRPTLQYYLLSNYYNMKYCPIFLSLAKLHLWLGFGRYCVIPQTIWVKVRSHFTNNFLFYSDFSTSYIYLYGKCKTLFSHLLFALHCGQLLMFFFCVIMYF